MDDTIHGTLAGWANFYLITGTAAAALTGLQFVVQTLLSTDALRPVTSGDPEGGISAFGTPTVVHFSFALVVSAVLCVGIHNAWDTVTYLTINAIRNVAPAAESAPPRHQNPGPRRRRRR